MERIAALTGAKQIYGGGYLLTAGRKQFLKGTKGGEDESTHCCFARSCGYLIHLGRLSRFFEIQITGHDTTVWWRASMGLLGFGIFLMMWQMLQHVSRLPR